MKKNSIFKILFMTLITFSSFALKDPTIATVNGVAIKKSTFAKTFKENLLFVSDKVVTKKKVLQDLINRELGIQKARKSKLERDPIVKYKMEDVLYHAQISKDLEPRLKKITVTDADVKAYYKKFPEYRTAHILFRVQVVPSQEEVKKAQELAVNTYKEVQKTPKRFSEYANRYSQSANSTNGGDIGFQPAIRMAPEYFSAIKGKKPGYITPPVRTQFGYHVIKVLASKAYKDINKTGYKKIVYDQKRDAILQGYFSELRERGKVVIKDKTILSADQ